MLESHVVVVRALIEPLPAGPRRHHGTDPVAVASFNRRDHAEVERENRPDKQHAFQHEALNRGSKANLF
jgi:hypothetical protein